MADLLRRDARPVDLPQLEAMAGAFCREFIPDLPDAPMRRLRTLRWLMTGGSPESPLLLRVLVAGDRLVGMIGLAITEHLISGERVASELFWYVLPEARRGGGLGLLYDAESWARAQGAQRLHMIAVTGNLGVGEVYAHRGYRLREQTYEKVL
jgi:GNAT superfamily N-acetyltransferase